MDRLPPALLRSLVDGPSCIAGVQWYDEVGSTNAEAAVCAAAGAPEVQLVLADVQTAGRGRRGRTWHAPAGSSLMLSLLVRPTVDARHLPLLPLLTGLVLAETVARFVPAADVAVKWPNDLLLAGNGSDSWRKTGGILVEGVPGAAVIGVGVNVDWREVARPPELREATSLAEVAGRDVDRWRLLAGFVGSFCNRYAAWQQLPTAFLAGYRSRCATIGRRVRVLRSDAEALEGIVSAVDDDGSLRLRLADGAAVSVTAGDVEHLRPA